MKNVNKRTRQLLEEDLRPYVCKHCGKVVLRHYTKVWVKSFCETTGKNVRLWRADYHLK